jgi:hypothetical protein
MATVTREQLQRLNEQPKVPSPDDLPEKQVIIARRSVPPSCPDCQSESRSHGSRVVIQQVQGWPK